MAARSAKGDGPLAELVRQRQDLVASHRLLDRSLVAASAKPPGERKAADEAALRDKIGATENQIDAIDLQLKQRFPEYAAIANPEPLTIAEAQKHLRADEALLLVLVDDGKGRDWIKDRDWIVAWVVTRDAVQFQVLDLGAKVLAEHVEALRCGLDAAQWEEMRGLQRIESRRERCRALVGPKAGDDLPFDLKRAHALYQGLLGPFSKLIADKHLLIVPDGPLAALPLQVLLTAPPDEGTATPAERYQKAAWLAAKHSSHRAALGCEPEGAAHGRRTQPRREGLRRLRKPAAYWRRRVGPQRLGGGRLQPCTASRGGRQHRQAAARYPA